MTVSAAVVNHNNIADFRLRQFAVNGKLVVVFAERTGHVAQVVGGCVFLPQNRDVVVSSVKRRSHQICHASIKTDVIFICRFFVKDFGNQIAERSCHHSSALHDDFRLFQSFLNNQFVVKFLNAGSDAV